MSTVSGTGNQILRERLAGLGLNAKEMATALGVSPSLVSLWLAGKRPVPDHWRQGIEGLRRHPAAGSKDVMVLDQSPVPYGRTVAQKAPPEHRGVPIVSYAQAGLGGDYADLAGQIDDWIAVQVADPNAYATIVTGDSMEPFLLDGDIIILAPNSVARTGQIVVARVAESGDVYVKRLRRMGADGKSVRLESFNELYKPMDFAESAFRFIHPVVEMRRKKM